MSQAGDISETGGPSPPDVPTQINTQDGNAVPLANILIVNGFDSEENNDNGIITKGGVVGTGIQNEVDVVLTNRVVGAITTLDATPVDMITFDLATGGATGVYIFTGDVTAYNINDNAGASYTFEAAARTSAGVGTEIAVEIKNSFEELAMAPATFSISVSGNNLLVSVTGIAAKAINWNSFFTYRFVGV